MWPISLHPSVHFWSARYEPYNFGKRHLTYLRLHFLIYKMALIFPCREMDTAKEYKHVAQWLVQVSTH